MKPTIKITLIYLIVGMIWILLSDRLLLLLFSDSTLRLAQFQTYKGLFYVISTAILLWFLVRYYYGQINRKVEELEDKTRKLQASNRDLEQFAYAASHDLQEPLRMITSFLSLLDTKYASSLDDKARQYIHFAVDGAARMRQVILDILEYSRIGKQQVQLEEVNLNELMEEVLQLQSQFIADKKATVEVGELPVVLAAHTPLVQVFQNLLGNALKYVSPGVAPVVHIRAQERANHWLLSVRDNGIGIEQEYLDDIFTIFRRLHTNDQYKGTGMGLAIVKRSLENMGGTIWVESAPGQGSTFFFTLPKSTNLG